MLTIIVVRCIIAFILHYFVVYLIFVRRASKVRKRPVGYTQAVRLDLGNEEFFIPPCQCIVPHLGSRNETDFLRP